MKTIKYVATIARGLGEHSSESGSIPYFKAKHVSYTARARCLVSLHSFNGDTFS